MCQQTNIEVKNGLMLFLSQFIPICLFVLIGKSQLHVQQNRRGKKSTVWGERDLVEIKPKYQHFRGNQKYVGWKFELGLWFAPSGSQIASFPRKLVKPRVEHHQQIRGLSKDFPML